MSRCLFHLMLFLISIFHTTFAMDIEAKKYYVTKTNADKVSVGVTVNEKQIDCGGSFSVYINYPKIYQTAKFRSVSISIEEDEKLLLHVPSVQISVDELMDYKPFHGTILCVDGSLLGKLKASISYGKGDLVTSVLIIKGFDGWVE